MTHASMSGCGHSSGCSLHKSFAFADTAECGCCIPDEPCGTVPNATLKGRSEENARCTPGNAAIRTSVPLNGPSSHLSRSRIRQSCDRLCCSHDVRPILPPVPSEQPKVRAPPRLGPHKAGYSTSQKYGHPLAKCTSGFKLAYHIEFRTTRVVPSNHGSGVHPLFLQNIGFSFGVMHPTSRGHASTYSCFLQVYYRCFSHQTIPAGASIMCSSFTERLADHCLHRLRAHLEDGKTRRANSTCISTGLTESHKCSSSGHAIDAPWPCHPRNQMP